ncbi:hypothetical protein [Streptomyces longwoodensis]|uniref:hypothetical protein n=1 Tax=Streptomyces longwoodensis TaxID=68231 RepID=UPI00224CA27B|nr:hypothetical protein [Streptomyces longwoodensis]MCX5000935.1 hypothetical protein [Streptomyces longwoodensis]
MAIATLNPDTEPIADPVSFEEAALLFQETQLPEFNIRVKPLVRKLQRWAKDDGLATDTRGRMLVVSFTDLLEAHARRYPAPGI